MGGQGGPGGPERVRTARDFGDLTADSDGVWLVLGGGGLKGMALIGAYRALEEVGLRPAGIVGTSIGSLIGSSIAGGMSADEMTEVALALDRKDIARLNRGAIWINGIRERSVLRGEVLREYYESVLPEGGWSALQVPLLINAVDLSDGSQQWFGPGARDDVSLVDAVYASSALPLFYPPFELDGRAYVDGGISRSLPIDRAQEEGATRIVAIDVGSGERSEVEEVLKQGMIGIHQRVLSIMMFRRRYEMVNRWGGVPLLYVRPRLDGYRTFDFDHVAYFLEEGYRAMREALDGL